MKPSGTINTFLTDINVDGHAIAIARSAWEIQIIRAVDLSMGRTPDSKLFEFAVQQGYVMVTGNFKDFVGMVTVWSESGKPHSGLLMIATTRHKNSYHIAEMLALYADENMINRVEWI